MTDHQASPADAPEGVQHAPDRAAQGLLTPRGDGATCARCGRPLPAPPRAATRFCAAACRYAAVRERRAAARADLLQALHQVQDAAARIERALRALGLHPSRPRRRPKERI